MVKQEDWDRVNTEFMVMVRVRPLIKCKRMSNAILYSEVFGTGFNTAQKRCEEMRIDPDAHKIEPFVDRFKR